MLLQLIMFKENISQSKQDVHFCQRQPSQETEAHFIMNKTGLQPVSRPVELVHYFGGWVEGPSKQTDRTDGGWVHKTFGAKAEQIELTALHAAKHL